jgi:TP901-1 family phage major tail protein
MAHTGLINGTDLIIKVGSDTVAYATSCSLELSADEIDQTSKDSGGWKDIAAGLRSWNMSADALYVNNAAASSEDGFPELTTALIARTAVTVHFTFGTAATGDYVYSGSAIITSLSLSSGVEDQATYSVTFNGTGALTQTLTS